MTLLHNTENLVDQISPFKVGLLKNREPIHSATLQSEIEEINTNESANVEENPYYVEALSDQGELSFEIDNTIIETDGSIELSIDFGGERLDSDDGVEFFILNSSIRYQVVNSELLIDDLFPSLIGAPEPVLLVATYGNEFGIAQIAVVGMDTDADGISDVSENTLGISGQGDARSTDTDGDGISDFEESIYRSDPLVNDVEHDDGVCASVRIQISQEAVMTRQGFEATLEVVNKVDQPIENLFLEIVVYDENGDIVEENAFGIDDPILSGLTAVDGTGAIAAGETGSAVFTVIPSRLAAADEAATYYVSGNFGYTQDGNQVTIPLSREEISVRPQAELELDYFLQRDVLGDDPFTDDLDETTTDDIEESVPATLAVMVSNVGAGDATDLRIVSSQPEIIENEKGLLVDFEIIGSEINGQAAQPTLEADFGDVASGDREVATWLLESTLQGKFVDYEVAFQHLNDLGIPELSLITEARIHELIQTVDVDGDDLPDFLVNDSRDALGIPDSIYTTAGDILEVGLGLATAEAAVPTSDGNALVTAQLGNGWTYLSLLEPSDAALEVVQITRDIDGDGDQDVLTTDNWWVTDRTFPAEGRPTYENVLHILDEGGPGELVYTVNYGTEKSLNVMPVAEDDAALTNEDNSVEISVLANDTDSDAGIVAISKVSQAQNGTVSYAVGGSVLTAPSSGYLGSLLYTPNVGFVGTDTFTYAITDNQGGYNTATVSVVVGTLGNFPPIAQNDVYSVNESETLIVSATNGVLANDTDDDGDVLQVVSVTDPVNGTLNVEADGSFAYTPNAGFVGAENLIYSVSDGLATVEGQFVINVESPPVLINIGDAPLRVSRAEPDAWENAWTNEVVEISHKANYLDTDEAWSSTTLSGRSSTALSGGDIFGGDLGVSGQSLVSSTIRQEIDGTEALRFTLTETATSVTVDLSRLEGDAVSGNFDAGRLQLFDDSGLIVDELVFSADIDGHEKQITLDHDTGFSSVVLTAGIYNDADFAFGGLANASGLYQSDSVDLGNGTWNGSDYLVDAIEFEFGEVQVIGTQVDQSA